MKCEPYNYKNVVTIERSYSVIMMSISVSTVEILGKHVVTQVRNKSVSARTQRLLGVI